MAVLGGLRPIGLGGADLGSLADPEGRLESAVRRLVDVLTVGA